MPATSAPRIAHAAAGSGELPGSDAMQDARRSMQVCNACRYCEGFCAVFPAMERRRSFTDGDLTYLANLCHGCRGCYYACQYAPPHPFGVNLPRTFSELRAETYETYAWPRSMGRLFRRSGPVAATVTAGSIALLLLLAMALQPAAVLYGVNSAPGAFYAVVPAWAMVGVASATMLFSLLALTIGVARFWRGTGSGAVPLTRPLAAAVRDVLTLRYLGGGGHGCNDLDERFALHRRRLHHALFYGFGLCFASTAVAALYEHVGGRIAPYPLLSLPVVLGTLGGVGMVVGAAGLAWVKAHGDPAPRSPASTQSEAALLLLLGMTAATGLLLLALRDTGAMGVLLVIHLGFVLALFLLMPYSKFVHGFYRSAALLRNAREARDEGP